MKTDFFITYHHSDELAARWIAAVLKEVPFSMFLESWQFLAAADSKCHVVRKGI